MLVGEPSSHLTETGFKLGTPSPHVNTPRIPFRVMNQITTKISFLSLKDAPTGQDDAQPSSLPSVWRTKPRGPTTLDTFHALIRAVDRPLRCIQCLWIMGPVGYGLEFTALFEGKGRHSALLLGGIHDDVERRVLGGTCPPFLEVAFAKSIGDELASHYGVEFYFPWRGRPNDRFPSWLDLPARQERSWYLDANFKARLRPWT